MDWSIVDVEEEEDVDNVVNDVSNCICSVACEMSCVLGMSEPLQLSVLWLLLSLLINVAIRSGRLGSGT